MITTANPLALSTTLNKVLKPKYIRLVYHPPKLCPHCKEVIEDNNLKYITFIYNYTEEQRKANRRDINRRLAEKCGEDTERFYEYL